MEPDYIAEEIAEYEALIEKLRQKIKELRFSAILNNEGEIISYSDWDT